MKLPKKVHVAFLSVTVFPRYKTNMQAEVTSMSGELFRETAYSYFLNKVKSEDVDISPDEIYIIPKGCVMRMQTDD